MVRSSTPKTSTAILLVLALAGTLPAAWSGDAHAAVTFTVNSTGDGADSDVQDGVCDSMGRSGEQCTLRAAIEQANSTSGKDTISFDIVSAAAVKTISPSSALPTITKPVIIDGYTQPGASPNTRARGNNAVLKIQLNGTNAGESVNGLRIDASNSTVKGLVINRFAEGIFGGSGIDVRGSSNRVAGNFIGTNASGTVGLGNGRGVSISSGASNRIGGTARGARNVIAGNDSHGVSIFGSSSVGTMIENNYIGTQRGGGAPLGNGGCGVDSFHSNDFTVGGTVGGARNVISGNAAAGVCIVGSGIEVQGNFIGTNASGTAALANGGGVVIRSGKDNTIGGSAAGAGNVISGNDGSGVYILEEDSTGNMVQGNFIGTDAAGTAGLGNTGSGLFIRAPDNTVGGTTAAAGNIISRNGEHGVEIEGSGNDVKGNAITANGLDGVHTSEGASGNIIGGGNAILGNGGDGVAVESASSGNRILSNQVFGNAGLGIDLAGGVEDSFAVTANDADDPDTGPNNLQNFPVIISAIRSNTCGQTTIAATLNSDPNQSFTIQWFVADGDPSDHGEGLTFLGETAAATDAGGDDGFSFVTSSVSPGQKVTATATNTATDDTSEFSLNRIVTAGP